MAGMDNSYGLIIGIAEYKNVNKLPQAVIKDAEDVFSILTDPTVCGYPLQNVRILKNQEATHVEILHALSNLASVCNKDSTVLIYFSCHGGRIEAGPYKGEYLIPFDTVIQSDITVYESAISGEVFTSMLNKIPAKKVVVIFDCCHSAGIGQPKDFSLTPIKSGLSEGYYDTLISGRGRVIFASSRSDEISWIMPGADNSLFTQFLLSGLRGGAPGTNGVIRIFDLFNYVQPFVTSAKSEQHPIFKAEVEENFPIALYLGGILPLNEQQLSQRNKSEYDVFISYRQREPEKSWVRNVLIPYLEMADVKVCIDFRDFQLGAPLVTEMARAVEESRYTLAVLTPAYLDSTFAELENILAEHLGLEKGQRRLIAIMRENCSPRLGIRAKLWLDMTDESGINRNLQRLVQEIKRSS